MLFLSEVRHLQMRNVEAMCRLSAVRCIRFPAFHHTYGALGETTTCNFNINVKPGHTWTLHHTITLSEFFALSMDHSFTYTSGLDPTYVHYHSQISQASFTFLFPSTLVKPASSCYLSPSKRTMRIVYTSFMTLSTVSAFF